MGSRNHLVSSWGIHGMRDESWLVRSALCNRFGNSRFRRGHPVEVTTSVGSGGRDGPGRPEREPHFSTDDEPDCQAWTTPMAH